MQTSYVVNTLAYIAFVTGVVIIAMKMGATIEIKFLNLITVEITMLKNNITDSWCGEAFARGFGLTKSLIMKRSDYAKCSLQAEALGFDSPSPRHSQFKVI